MNNNERKNDFQSFHDQWCEDWVEDWQEVWNDGVSSNIKQTPKDRYKKAQPNVSGFKKETVLENVSNHHSNDEVYEYKDEPSNDKEYEYKVETISHKEHQDKSKSNFLDYVDELEAALKTQTHVSEASNVQDEVANHPLDVVISMD